MPGKVAPFQSIQRKGTFTLTIAIALMLATVEQIWADQPLPGPWHFKSVPCVDTSIQGVFPRIGDSRQRHFTPHDFEQSGIVVIYNSTLGTNPTVRNLKASITHYQGTAGNDVMINERPGDTVQLCFLGAPAPTEACNPDTDSRGRLYRVYDYRQNAEYEGENAQHTCGGA
jgi:hypothetical protein